MIRSLAFLCLILFPFSLFGSERSYEISRKVFSQEDFNLNSFEHSLSIGETVVLSYYQEEPLQVGTFDLEYIYAIYRGDPIGLTLHFVYLLKELLGIKVEIQDYPFTVESSTDPLERNEVDIIPLLSEPFITNPRILLSDLLTTKKVYLYASHHTPESLVDTITNTRLGIYKNSPSIFAEEVEDYLSQMGLNTELIVYSNREELYQATLRGELDYFMDGLSQKHILKGFLPRVIYLPLVSGKYYVGINTESFNAPLLGIVNKLLAYPGILDSFRAYEREEKLMKIRDGDYFTEEEKFFINSTAKNPIVLVNTAPPTTMIRKNELGKLKGPYIDIWERITEITGLNLKYKDLGGGPPSTVLKTQGMDRIQGVDGILYAEDTKSGDKDLEFLPIGVYDTKLLVGIFSPEGIISQDRLYEYQVGSLQGDSLVRAFNKDSLNTFLPREYKELEDIVKALQEGAIDIAMLRTFDYLYAFHQQKNYNLQIKKYTNYSAYMSSALFTDGPNHKYLYPIILKSLVAIDYLDYINATLVSTTSVQELLKKERSRINRVSISVALILVLSIIIHYLKHKANKDLWHVKIASTSNHLTGLRNKQALVQANHKGKRVASVYVIDIDRFHKINDIYGIKVGNSILRSVAERLKSYFDEKKFKIYHTEADRYIVTDSSSEADTDMAQELINFIGDDLFLEGTSFNISTSIGMANINAGEKLQEGITKATLALKTVKANSLEEHGSPVALADEDVYADHRKLQVLQRSLSSVSSLESAMIPYFQFYYDLKNSRTLGAEVLTRINHTQMGFLLPDEFIPILKKNDIMGKLDALIIRKGCEALSRWRKEGLVEEDFTLSFNLSAEALDSLNFRSLLQEVTDKYKIPMKNILLEIREHALNNEGRARHNLLVLAELGVYITIDNFQAGYSSIPQISNLSVSRIKTDRNLLALGNSKRVKEIFLTIKKLGRQNNLLVLVQGVEQKSQERFIRELGFHVVQGFLYSTPLLENDFISSLNNFLKENDTPLSET